MNACASERACVVSEPRWLTNISMTELLMFAVTALLMKSAVPVIVLWPELETVVAESILINVVSGGFGPGAISALVMPCCPAESTI